MLIATSPDLLLTGLIFAAALLYSTVGHAGASGYLAVLALFGIAPAEMKPAALILNVLVATIATIQFARAGHFRWSLLRPFAVAAVPCAFLGGGIRLDPALYRPLIALALLCSAARLILVRRRDDDAIRSPAWWQALPIGAALGFIAGLTGVGGGIFLSPVLLFCRWADTRTTAAVSAAFIWLNSIAGLLGHASTGQMLPRQLPMWAAAAMLGGALGSWWGSQRAQPAGLRQMLATVLILAGGKLLLM
ncbi:MAG: sulfite exporter TauE/SafE family protein [Opitutae bacterium]|nr:sulfite exporter TauE/SafE family protein [Opitutae bacterium]